MKRAAVLQILILFLITSAGAQSRTDRMTMGLLGEVKSLETGRVEYSLKEKKPVAGARVPFQRILFNPEGNKIEESNYQDGVFSSGNVYTYDSAGFRTGYQETYNPLGKPPSKPRQHQYLTDGRGNITEYTVYEADDTIAIRFIYLYNQAGEKIEEQTFFHTGAFGGKTLHQYDSAGSETETVYYDRNGAVGWKQNFKYDNRGRRIELIQYSGEVLRYRIHTSYDDKGRPLAVETIEFNATPGVYITHSPVPGKVIYVYDDEKMTKSVSSYNATGVLTGRTIYAYDEKGGEIGRRELNADGSSKYQEISWYQNNQLVRGLRGDSVTRIDYDAHGNWINKTYFLAQQSGEPEAYRSEFRTIVYY